MSSYEEVEQNLSNFIVLHIKVSLGSMPEDIYDKFRLMAVGFEVPHIEHWDVEDTPMPDIEDLMVYTIEDANEAFQESVQYLTPP